MSTSRERFIELHGEDAWEIEKEKRRELNRIASKKYNETHKEERRIHRQENKDKHAQAQKRYRERHKDELREKNIEQCRKYYHSHSGRALGLIHKYSQSDIEEKRDNCTLTKEWVINNIFNSSCVYCGDSNWKHLGVDRIDNNLPHTPENCVCACGICNCERQIKKMSMAEFVEYRKTHPRELKPKKLQEIVEINGKRVLKKVG